jgi:hypothetical protein
VQCLVLSWYAVVQDGGTDPVWQEQVSFEVVDQYLLDIEVPLLAALV